MLKVMSSRPQNPNLMGRPHVVRMLLPIYGRRWMAKTRFLINFVHKSSQNSLVPASIYELGVSFCPGDVLDANGEHINSRGSITQDAEQRWTGWP